MSDFDPLRGEVSKVSSIRCPNKSVFLVLLIGLNQMFVLFHFPDGEIACVRPPGPPTENHSVASVVVGRGSNDELSPVEVSGFSRVQQAVAKAAVIAVPPFQPIVPAAVAVATATAAAVGSASPGEGSPTAVEDEGSASRSAGRGDGVRYVTLHFHSVSSRA